MGLNLNLNINGAKRGLATPPVPTDVVITVVSDTAFSIAYVSAFPVEFWYSTTEGGVYTKHGDSASTPYAMTGLTAGTQYWVKARAVNGSKFSDFTAAANATTTLSAPTAFTSVFTVDTITGTLAWTDNSGGLATYEVYSNTNEAGDVLLTTTAAGATSYGDTACKQNATVVYKIRAKKGTVYSDYATATALVTPLCWKTNQSTRGNVVINSLIIAAGKTVNIDWGDGTNANYTGTNTSITKTYAASAVTVFNIIISGDTNYITSLQNFSQIKSYGDISNWVLPSSMQYFLLYSTSVTGDISNWVLPSSMITLRLNETVLQGDISNWVLPSSMQYFLLFSTSVTGDISNWVLPSSMLGFSIYLTNIEGKIPQISPHISSAISYRVNQCNFYDSNITTFKKAMSVFDVSNQAVTFSTANVDKLLKALADWYEVNAPTVNCTFDMSGANMGIPSLGASNTDLVRLAGYYTAAGKTATIVVRSS